MRATPPKELNGIVFRLYQDCVEIWTQREVDYLLELLDCFPETRWDFVRRGLKVAQLRLRGRTFREIGADLGVSPARAGQYLQMGYRRAREFCRHARSNPKAIIARCAH